MHMADSTSLCSHSQQRALGTKSTQILAIVMNTIHVLRVCAFLHACLLDLNIIRLSSDLS